MIKLAIFTYIMAILLISLSGCRSMQQAPISHLYVIDTQHNVCSKRVITNKQTLASKWVQDLPLEACDGNISLEPQEFLDLRTFLKRFR